MKFTKKLINESNYHEEYNNFNFIVKATSSKNTYIIDKNGILMIITDNINDIDENLPENIYPKYKEVYVAIDSSEEDSFEQLYEVATKIGYSEFEKKINKLFDSTINVVNKRERPQLLEIRNDIIKRLMNKRFSFYVMK